MRQDAPAARIRQQLWTGAWHVCAMLLVFAVATYIRVIPVGDPATFTRQDFTPPCDNLCSCSAMTECPTMVAVLHAPTFPPLFILLVGLAAGALRTMQGRRTESDGWAWSPKRRRAFLQVFRC